MNIDYIQEIRTVLKYLGIKHRHLCRVSGISETYLDSIMHGKTVYPKINCLFALADGLRILIKGKHTTESIRRDIGNNILLDFIDIINKRK